MDIEDFARYQRTSKGKGDILKLWDSIKTRSIENIPTFLEWLTWRIFLGIDNITIPLKDTTFMGLNNDFTPKNCSPCNKPDLIFRFPNLDIIGEVTQRPIPGKIEHFSHIERANKLYDSRFIGVLISQINVDKIPPETWNTYKSSFDNGNPLFIITDIDFLINNLVLLNNDPFSTWIKYVDESKRIWKEFSNWKSIKENVISIKDNILCGD